MRVKGHLWTATGYLLVLMLALVGAGCGGGGGGNSASEGSFESYAEVVARVGPIVAVRVGETAVVSDRNSFTTTNKSMSYQWTFVSRPQGSAAVLQNPTSQNASFVADVWGIYRVQLVVSAGGFTSARAVQVVVVTNPGEDPTGPSNHSGLSSSCGQCHNDVFSTIAAKSGSHISATNNCESCHTPLGFNQITFVDHLEVIGACSQCHNNQIAVGKSRFHIDTTQECDDCHNTTSFLDLAPDGSFDHSSITSGCARCHNGEIAIGKTPSPPHPDTNVECVFCHTVDSFKNPFVDHTGPAVVGNRCDSCHGVSAIGPPASPDHPVLAVDCEVCHSITGFSMGGVYPHQLVDWTLQTCESCHFDGNNVGSVVNAPSKADAVPTHVATSDDCANCHNTDNFLPAFIDHTKPPVIGNACDSCHDGTSATGKIDSPTPHLPTNRDCGACHTPGTFTTGVFDHKMDDGVTDIVTGCETCHDNVITLGKLPNHLPTTAGCETCHTTTSFLTAVWNHAGIDVNDCAQCHDGNIALGTADAPTPHIPTNPADDCSLCHDPFNYTTFAGITYNHQGIDPNNCAACHATGFARPKKSNHIPTQDDCSVCHTSTSDFLNNGFLGGVHAGITRGCEGCHQDFFFPGDLTRTKGPAHLPTNQDCYLCHTVGGFTAPTIFAHTGIADNCTSCHDGSFSAINALGKADAPTPHIATTEDCGICHNTTAFSPAFVDHSGPSVVGNRCDSCHDGVSAIGKIDAPTPHVPTTQDCGVCHVPGGAFSPAIFDHTGIVDNCQSCHDGTIATGKADAPTPHVATTLDCHFCHNTAGFANAKFDHQGITDNCASCHDGVTARGKHNNHVPTNDDCSVCHQTTGFLPATFSHAGIVDNCSSCHNDTFAQGKKTGHVATNEDCGVCHNTQGFIPATFDHTGIVDNCASCHVDGSPGITGKDDAVPAHIATSLDCHLCHTTATFAGGSWYHDASTVGMCDTCHSPGGGATPKPGGHLATTYQCDTCHVTSGWAPTTFSHDPSGDYPGDHRRNLACSQCHGPSIDPPFAWDFPQYAPFCAACHANDFRRKDKHIGGENGTVAQNKNCGQSGCHRITASEF